MDGSCLRWCRCFTTEKLFLLNGEGLLPRVPPAKPVGTLGLPFGVPPRSTGQARGASPHPSRLLRLRLECPQSLGRGWGYSWNLQWYQGFEPPVRFPSRDWGEGPLARGKRRGGGDLWGRWKRRAGGEGTVKSEKKEEAIPDLLVQGLGFSSSLHPRITCSNLCGEGPVTGKAGPARHGVDVERAGAVLACAGRGRRGGRAPRGGRRDGRALTRGSAGSRLSPRKSVRIFAAPRAYFRRTRKDAR